MVIQFPAPTQRLQDARAAGELLLRRIITRTTAGKARNGASFVDYSRPYDEQKHAAVHTPDSTKGAR